MIDMGDRYWERSIWVGDVREEGWELEDKSGEGISVGRG